MTAPKSAATRAKHRAAMLGNLNRAMFGRAKLVDRELVHASAIRLGQAIRDVRLERNVSQDELAAAIRGNRRTIHCIECAISNPSAQMLIKIALALDVSLAELMP